MDFIQTGDKVGTISGWDIRYPIQPENEYAVLISRDGKEKYALKTWPSPEEWSLYPSVYCRLGCADNQLIYTFYMKYGGGGIFLPDLTSFSGSLNLESLTDESEG